MRRGQRDFIDRLQGQYNNDAVVHAEKLKQKEDARRQERIAKCEKMGLGLGTRLGTATGPPTPASRNKQNCEIQRRSFVDQVQGQYDRDAIARAEKLRKKEEEKQFQEQLLMAERISLQDNALAGDGGYVTGTPIATVGVSDAEARRRSVSRLQEQYRNAREQPNMAE